MSDKPNPRAAIHTLLIFTGSGPILVLSTYPSPDDGRLIEKLRYKGITRFMAYEVELLAARERYPRSFDKVVSDLEGVEDVRVLDYNGHQIMANFSLSQLGDPVSISD